MSSLRSCKEKLQLLNMPTLGFTGSEAVIYLFIFLFKLIPIFAFSGHNESSIVQPLKPTSVLDLVLRLFFLLPQEALLTK